MFCCLSTSIPPGWHEKEDVLGFQSTHISFISLLSLRCVTCWGSSVKPGSVTLPDRVLRPSFKNTSATGVIPRCEVPHGLGTQRGSPRGQCQVFCWRFLKNRPDTSTCHWVERTVTSQNWQQPGWVMLSGWKLPQTGGRKVRKPAANYTRPKFTAKLSHISNELFSKKITSQKNGGLSREGDARAGLWWITFENETQRHENFKGWQVQSMNGNIFLFFPIDHQRNQRSNNCCVISELTPLSATHTDW